MNHLSRRNFISLGARALSGALLLPPASGLLESCSKTPLITDLDWKYLDNQLMGEVLLPNGSAIWNSFTTSYALQYGKIVPKAVVRCVNEKDVSTAIKWARERELPLVTRSGGHSYAGFSSTYGLLLDLSMMTDISIDLSKGLATVAGGARNRNVYATLRDPNLSITHGRCKAVGVGGLVLGGGIGFNMRYNGLTCDSLVETTMVTAEGEIIKCSDTENKELFWAIRGAGGGNFGVHTSFVFKPFPVKTVTRFNLFWDSRAINILMKLQEVLLTAPNELGAKVSVEAVPTRKPKNTIRVRLLGQLRGSKQEIEAILKPVTDILTPNGLGTMIEEPYWDAQEFLSENGEPEYVQERCRFAFEPISEAGYYAILSNLEDWPKNSGYAMWKYFLTGGAIDKIPKEATAFWARGVKMITSIDIGWDPKVDKNIPENLTWIDRFHDQMELYTSKHCFINFIDRRQKNHLDAYYGPHLERLKQVKRIVDPTNFFNFPMGIPVS